MFHIHYERLVRKTRAVLYPLCAVKKFKIFIVRMSEIVVVQRSSNRLFIENNPRCFILLEIREGNAIYNLVCLVKGRSMFHVETKRLAYISRTVIEDFSTLKTIKYNGLLIFDLRS